MAHHAPNAPTGPSRAVQRAAKAAGRPSQLLFVRHAESVRNLAKQGHRFFAAPGHRAGVQGLADHLTPLTERGRLQARATGVALRAALGPVDLAWHSGYRRTAETLEGLLLAYTAAERQRMRIAHHLFLRERDTGYTFDMTAVEVARAFPWLEDYWNTAGAIFGRPPGGESLADVAKRAHLFLGMLFREAAGRRVLVVTHGGTLWMLRMLLERWTWEEAEDRYRTGSIPQCSLTAYTFDPPAGRLVATAVTRVYYTPDDLAAAAAGDRG